MHEGNCCLMEKNWGKIITREKEIFPNHLSFKNKKQKGKYSMFFRKAWKGMSRRHSNGTHTKELSMKKSEIAMCKSPCRAITKVCFTMTVNHLYLTSLHSCNGGHTQWEVSHWKQEAPLERYIIPGGWEGKGKGWGEWRGQGKVAFNLLLISYLMHWRNMRKRIKAYIYEHILHIQIASYWCSFLLEWHSSSPIDMSPCNMPIRSPQPCLGGADGPGDRKEAALWIIQCDWFTVVQQHRNQ